MENAKVINTEFSTVEVTRNYLVVTMGDGCNLGEDELLSIQGIANEHIEGDMGYISHHKNDYSISPVDVVRFIIQTPRLKYIAYVSHIGDHKSRLMALLSLIPSTVKFKTFRSMEAAVYWMEENLKLEQRYNVEHVRKRKVS